jgi:hypothetical protein
MLALPAFAQFIVAADYNIGYVALPDIGSALGFTAQSLQWVVSAYAVTFGGLLLFGGRFEEGAERNRALGGPLTNARGWEWVLFILVPMALPAAWAAWRRGAYLDSHAVLHDRPGRTVARREPRHRAAVG